MTRTARISKWKAANPTKHAAHKCVEKAVKDGILVRQPCERCGADRFIHAHHDDYTKPLDVSWLCPTHHTARHRELGDTIPIPDSIAPPKPQDGVPNRRLSANSPTGYKGVSLRPNGRFQATVSYKKKIYKVGTFATAIEAAVAYDIRAIGIVGPNAWQNFPSMGSVNANVKHQTLPSFQRLEKRPAKDATQISGTEAPTPELFTLPDQTLKGTSMPLSVTTAIGAKP